ncbi:helix-turn-helix domain-containing protein [Paenibacillus sp. HN-1]|uniref:AraC family transcriptional regulator n=1 Tax=Paenibacillus sp. CGMCC 1.18879 TaxID=2834466 RepID=UPI001CA7DF06|nr:AraC family transcriptional regulator [Paenibacillus sp. CGMCC 1.18879]MBY9080720.1 helix-turn-helix domain-containing protein [Paenibacillus sp. CGMCC 1.18879]MBY9085288.1 helix-turn-helix domain-containing protein [Paenibacillus sinensis]
METSHIISQLSALEPAEQAYQHLYVANPYDDIDPVSSWDDFEEHYRQLAAKEYISFPDAPISDIATRFYEHQFFSQPAPLLSDFTADQMNELIYPPHMDSGVVAFKHLRYLPPFLHSLEFVKLVYVVSGRCYFYLKGQKRMIPAGGLIIVGPNVQQAFYANHDEDLVINVIMRRSTFENAFSPLLMERNQISDFFWQMLYVKNFSHVLLFQCNADSEIKKLLLNLYAESQLEPNKSLIIMNSYVLLLFGQLIRYHLDQVQSLTGDAHKHTISLILRYIRNNYQTADLSMLAQHFNLSKGYLSRYIKAETGYSFSALLQQLRMKEAADILKNSSISIEEIVASVGYTDISNFYRKFKLLFGTTPSEFRKHYRE